MQAPSDRWEQGSEFHWLSYDPSPAVLMPWTHGGGFWGSGRDAFKALLSYGQQTRGWRRLWVPSYFCQDVVAALLTTGIEVLAYPQGPADVRTESFEICCKPGDVLLLSNTFGLYSTRTPARVKRNDVELIEDHTHDPWSAWAYTSDADFCIASLRKTLPVPDGAVLWSPVGHHLPHPSQVTYQRSNASLQKLVGMLLKGLYIQGHDIDKSVFRALAVSGETLLASGQVSGMSDWARVLLETFPILNWRESRCRNHQALTTALKDLRWLDILRPDMDSRSCPFSGIMVFDSSELREFVRQRLIDQRVYAAVLWSLEKPLIAGIPARHVDLSQRMLSVHCDMRYTVVDMERVASLVREAGERF